MLSADTGPAHCVCHSMCTVYKGYCVILLVTRPRIPESGTLNSTIPIPESDEVKVL